MTVQISTLAIRPDLDAGRFSAGANEMARAQQQIVAGAREVSVAMTDASGKISAAGDPIERMNRRFVAGHREMTEFTKGMRDLNRSLETGRLQAEPAAMLYQGMAQKLGLVANASDITRQGYVQLGAVVERVNAQMTQSQSLAAMSRRMPVNDNMASFRRQNLMYQAFDIGQTIGPLGVTRTLMQQGPQIAQMYAGQGGVNAALSDAGSLAGSLVRRLWPVALAAAAGGAAIGSMQKEIEKATGKSVTFGETFSAAIKVVSDDIKSVLSPVVETLSPTILAAWDKLTAGAILTGDTIINSFHAAYIDVEYLWSQFPNMMGSLVTKGLNAMTNGIQDMTQTGAGYIDKFLNKVNEALDKADERMPGRGYRLGNIGKLEFGPPMPDQNSEELRKATEERNRRVKEIMESSPLSEYYRRVREGVQDQVGFGLPGGSAGGSIPIPTFRGIDDNPADQDYVTDFKRQSELRIEQMKQEITAVGLSGKALSAYRFEMDALNAAAAKNIELSPAQRDMIRQQAEALAAYDGPVGRADISQTMEFGKETLQ